MGHVINNGDTAFMIICTALVCLMTPGLAFFYGGLVRKKNVLIIMMQSFISMGIVTVIWIFGGFGLAFGADHFGIIGNIGDFFALRNVGVYANAMHGATIPFLMFFVYQLMFCVITAPLMTGAFAGRINIKGYIWLLIVWTILIYIPVCHWVWGGGFLAKMGFVDFAGGTVIHTSAGFGALACVLFFGKRVMKPGEKTDPNNLVIVAIGTGLLWFGWFGFNSGGALAANQLAATAFVNTAVALAVAMVAWMIIVKIKNGRIAFTDLLTGSVAGLATITPCAGYVEPWAAVIIGIVAAIVCSLCISLKNKMKWDDALDVWGVHGMGGFTGSLLIGVLASASVNGVSAGGHQFLVQLFGAALVAVYSFVATYIILKVLDSIFSIKATPEQQLKGLDDMLLGEKAYWD
ncbi:ammonium transporter [Clostridium sardiniense]|uniref:Ammonium transporter n=1 Tax=Clostridium sardiniense TaxID=29369 RepID=A0ABS7L0F5_CLOSR|nr:ammonium transporter [Clostridium sardiniense]MBM7833410.1 Amt family ammonium transporter [Clostridium sardiniense]MBY0756372.1 ammonium transporter [Clostridium sardiniense]MDQ0459218.1 Amt family ammonium transporter [Clostridium sardiniense]